MYNKTLYLFQLINFIGEWKMKGKKYRGELDYEKIVIYPYEYSTKTRQRLYKALRELDVRIECEQY